MQHCLAYHGAFENNFADLKPGAKTFKGTDGAERPLPPTPSECDGIRISYMEKTGKKFVAVRVQHDAKDVVLKNEVLLDPVRHLGLGKRFSPEPTVVNDDVAAAVLEDIMAKNPDQRKELSAIRSIFSVSAKSQGKR